MRRGELRGLRWIQGYYLASPFFFLFGLWWGVEVRVTFITEPGPRFLYYLVLSGLGLLAHFRPRSAPWVALGESALNLLLIMLWILLPIYSLADDPGSRGAGSPLHARSGPGERTFGGRFLYSRLLPGPGGHRGRLPLVGHGTKERPRKPIEASGAIESGFPGWPLLRWPVQAVLRPAAYLARPATCSPTRIFPISSRWIWFVPS